MLISPRILLILYCLFWVSFSSYGQKSIDCPGWTGELIVSDDEFYIGTHWTANASEGNTCSVTSSDTSVDLHWNLKAGQGQWAQCFLVLDQPVSLTKYDIFRFDLHGSVCDEGYPCHKQHVVEIKFEDGSNQAIFTRMGEDGILCVNRWINGLFFHIYDDDFSIPKNFDWEHVQVISFGVKPNPWVDSPAADSGVFSFRNLAADSTGGWTRSSELESLVIPADTLSAVNQDALEFILSRQTATGLLTTWAEDGLSWLYGQGLALKILALEGEWDDQHNPINEYAEAAQSLARFLAGQQKAEGYWPRSWNSYSGQPVVLYEDDGTIWMGDFPWVLTGLGSYYKKSRDAYVTTAICAGTDFLKSLIDPDGKFYALHVPSGERIPVTSSEAYAAAIGALFELGENDLASKLITYIHNNTWNTDLKYWKESIYSDRVVLFANTWLSLLLYERGFEQESLDALTLAGSLMYTCGPAEPCGLDGIGPIATWYEGTLSYIAAGGCGSNLLFNSIKPFINNDGSVPHYNDTIGSTAGIWAENWESLDGTSWLYFVTKNTSPFDVLPSELEIDCVNGIDWISKQESLLVLRPNPCKDYLHVCFDGWPDALGTYTIVNNLGQVLLKGNFEGVTPEFRICVAHLKPGLYLAYFTSMIGVYAEQFVKE